MYLKTIITLHLLAATLIGGLGVTVPPIGVTLPGIGGVGTTPISVGLGGLGGLGALTSDLTYFPTPLQLLLDGPALGEEFIGPWDDLTESDGLESSDNPLLKIVQKLWNPPPQTAAKEKKKKSKRIQKLGSYVFNPNSTNNVAVYFGQTPKTSTTNLTNMCNDPSIDIVILGFVTAANGAMGYPNISFGPTCGTQTAAQKAYAPGLLNCRYLAPQISYCQSIGKKVFLSLGGASGNVTLYSSTQATNFANTLWNLFGSGYSGNQQLRPFGGVAVDGFDLDNESKIGTYYDVFASTMKSLFATNTTKANYLSSTTQCTYPDPSVPVTYVQNSDFIWVRFYNDLACNLGTSKFQSTLAKISASLPGTVPRIYIGALAYQTTGSGYVPPDNYGPIVSAVAGSYPNLGGVMLWDGTEAHITKNVAGNMTFAQVAKAATYPASSAHQANQKRAAMVRRILFSDRVLRWFQIIGY